MTTIHLGNTFRWALATGIATFGMTSLSGVHADCEFARGKNVNHCDDGWNVGFTVFPDDSDGEKWYSVDGGHYGSAFVSLSCVSVSGAGWRVFNGVVDKTLFARCCSATEKGLCNFNTSWCGDLVECAEK